MKLRAVAVLLAFGLISLHSIDIALAEEADATIGESNPAYLGAEYRVVHTSSAKVSALSVCQDSRLCRQFRNDSLFPVGATMYEHERGKNDLAVRVGASDLLTDPTAGVEIHLGW